MMFSLIRRLRTHFLAAYTTLRWRARLPRLPVSADGKRLLHIGCGDIDSAEFINLDARPLPHVHFVRQDITRLPMIPDQAFDLVYLCHVLEHIPRAQLRATLRELGRILKPGGTLRISVPDFDLMVALYEAAGRNLQVIAPALMGGQDYAFNFHYGVFNRAYLTGQLDQTGFQDVRTWDPHTCAHHDFDDWASRSLYLGDTPYPVSLNLEARKP